MGKVYTKLFGKKPVRMLIMGLDAAGKTTALYQLKLGELVTTIPTIGFNVESFEHNNLNVTMWDVGMRDKARPLMRHYFPNTDAIVYIIDSNDRERLDETKEELHRYLNEDELRKCPLLVLANKQDCDNAMSPEYLAEKLELHKLRNREWTIQPTCATSGEGLRDGLDWLSDIISYNKAKETYKYIGNSATKTVTDNKTITTGWNYAVCGLDKMRNWIWGNSKPPLEAPSSSA